MNPLQYDRPLFIHLPINIRGKTWKQGEHFPWKEMNIDQKKVEIWYYNQYLRHNTEQEVAMNVGDGLEILDVEGLHQIVDDYNERVKKVTKHNTEFLRRKAPKSKIADKQRGLLRSWRRNNLDWLEKAEQNK